MDPWSLVLCFTKHRLCIISLFVWWLGQSEAKVTLLSIKHIDALVDLLTCPVAVANSLQPVWKKSLFLGELKS